MLTVRTLEGGLLNLAVVPNNSGSTVWRALVWSSTTRLQHCVPRCSTLSLVCKGSRWTPVTYPSSTSLWHRIGSLLARRGFADSSASSTWSCPWIHRLIFAFPSTEISCVAWMTRSSTFIYKHSCEQPLPREELDLAIADMKSVRAWTDLANWIRSLGAVATMFPDGVENKNTRKGKSRLRILMAPAKPDRFEWYMNNARIRTTQSARESTLMGSGTCGKRGTTC